MTLIYVCASQQYKLNSGRRNMLFSILLLVSLQLTSGRNVEIISCSASIQQSGFPCSSAHDGIWTDTIGWAMSGVLPSWAVFSLEKEVIVLDRIRFLSDIDRNDHMMTSFMVEVDIKGVWNKLENLAIVEDPAAIIADGRITLSQNLHDIELQFAKTALTASVRLTVYEADSGAINNMVVTEIIVPSKEVFNTIMVAPSDQRVRLGVIF